MLGTFNRSFAFGGRPGPAGPSGDPFWSSVIFLAYFDGNANEETGLTPQYWPTYGNGPAPNFTPIPRNPYVPSATGGMFGGSSGDTPLADPIQMPPYYTLTSGTTGAITVEATVYITAADISRIMSGFTMPILSQSSGQSVMTITYVDRGVGNRFYLETGAAFGANKVWILGTTLSEGFFRFAYERDASNLIYGYSNGVKLTENRFGSGPVFGAGVEFIVRSSFKTNPQDGDLSQLNDWSHRICDVRITKAARFNGAPSYTLATGKFPNF